MEFSKALTSGASQARLARLIAARLEDGADRAAIDRRIWVLFGERWAIMFTDLAGFSRKVAEFGIVHFLQVIYRAEQLLMPIIEAHDGILLKVEGDSYLIIFRNPAKSVTAAIAMQRCLGEHNRGLAPEDQVLLKVGLGYDDVFGAEVNGASKLGEDTAGPHEILVTGAVLDHALAVSGVTGSEPIDFVPPGAESAHRLVYE